MIAHVFPPQTPLRGEIDPPSSKNFTTRYILASSLSAGRSIVHRPAVQDDAVALVGCCLAMGAEITALDAAGNPIDFIVSNGEKVDRLEIIGFGRTPRLRNPGQPLNPGNAGAVFRMLLAVSALIPDVEWVTDHHDSLGKRPNIDLIDALKQLGVQVEHHGPEGFLPIRMKGGYDRIKSHLAARRKELALAPDAPFPVTVSGEVSSQFTSALLFLAPLLDEKLKFEVTGLLKSLPLIETTRNVLSMAGVSIESSGDRDWHIVPTGQVYTARHWQTNGDWPGTAAILAAAAVVPGSRITLGRLYHDEQGEKECVPFYEKMGCKATWTPRGSDGRTLLFESPADQPLHGASVNGDLCTDAVLAMMGAAFAAEGESRFVDIRNLQFKECDRVREPIDELRKIRATVLPAANPSTAEAPRRPARKDAQPLWYEPEDDPDTIHIEGAPQGYEGGIEVDGRGDHRVIMLLSIAALRCRKGLRIRGAEHVSKSFPGWFRTLRAMGIRVEEE